MPAPRHRQSTGFRGFDLFDPVEQEILRLFFGLPPTLDRALLAAEPEEEEPEEERCVTPQDQDAALGVRLGDRQEDTNHPDPQVAVAVARICLHVIGRRRPPRPGRTFSETVADASGREDFPEKDHRAHRLFTIDWAMGSWTESYFAIPVPGFDRYVVVKESEPEGTGGPWVALGWVPAGTDVVEGARPIVTDWWSFQADHSQEHWESFWSAGQVGEETAVAWAEEVWDEWEGHEAPAQDDEDEAEA